MMFAGCKNKDAQTTDNPFLKPYGTPFDVPPFHLITEDHYLPAYEEGMKQHNADIEAIVNNTEAASFENTIVAYDNSGELLRNVSIVFGGVNGAETNPRLQEIAREITPKITAHYDAIRLNEKLFARIKDVYDQKENLNLDIEQKRVVEKIYRDFTRNGAALPAEKREQLKKINERLAMVSLQLGENLLAETNDFKIVIDKKEDLAGLPESVVSAAEQEAKNANMEGKWVFTVQKPSMLPFLQFAENRALREKLYKGYYMRGDNDNDHDNKALFAELIKLRDDRSKLLGYKNYAAFAIDDNMAKTPEAVYEFLQRVWAPALEVAKSDLAEMQKIADSEGADFKLQSWDWWYYNEKLRKQKFDLDEDELRPYFSAKGVREGIFMLANKLYGLQFKANKDIPVYHPEVEAFEVMEADSSHLGVLMIDLHPRPGKRGGAWCGTYRPGSYVDGKKVAPIVTIVCNFTRPVGDKPALLSWDETTTLFHEFGHGLHNLFADGHYRRTSRDVPRDFVELPSQVLENWAGEPEMLKKYALHYETGEPIPDELIQKMQNSAQFNQGFITVEYIAACLLDLDYHTMDVSGNLDIRAIEKASLEKMGLIDEILPRYRTTYFSHIFSGGYAAGYYVYLWAGVLDSDAFDAFKLSGDIFNPELAAKFRQHILAQNAMGEGMDQYLKFRGQEPSIDPLLKRRGLK